MTITPHLNRVVIKPKLEHTPSKIIVPEQVKKFSNEGEVIAVGPGRRHIDGKIYPPSIQNGETVLFNQNNAMPFEFEGEKYVLCDEENVLVRFLNAKAAPEQN